MRILFTTIYVIILLVLFAYELYKTKDLFSPKSFFIMLELLCYPYGLFTKTMDSYMIITDEIVCRIVGINLLYTFSFLLGYRFFDRVSLKSTNIEIKIPQVGRGMTWAIFLIGFTAKIYTFIQIGGIRAIISNVSLAYSSQSSGFGFMFLLYRFMLFAVLIELQRYIDEKKTIDLVYSIIMALLYMMSYLVYSSRGPAFELVLIILFVVNYKYKKIKIRSFLKPKIIIPLLLVAFLSMSVVNMRNKNNDYARVSNPIVGILDEYSHVGRDAFVYEHFDSENLFYGKSIINIVTFWIPSSIYHDKPVIDDGLYIVNNIKGFNSDINDSINELNIRSGSIPFTNQGILYANFSLVGIVLGAFLLAAFRVYFYKRWALSEKSALICLYFYGVYMFGLTPLKFVNTLTIFIAFIIANNIGRLKLRVNREVILRK